MKVQGSLTCSLFLNVGTVYLYAGETTKKNCCNIIASTLGYVTVKEVQEGIGDIMGGKVLEYEAKTIYNKGVDAGRVEGLAAGRVEGLAAGKQETNDAAMEAIIKMQKEGISSEDIVKELLKRFSDTSNT